MVYKLQTGIRHAKRKFSVTVVGLAALAFPAIIALSGGAANAAATSWYVSNTGNDSNDCLSPATACATIGGALGKAGTGDIINVAAGTYAGPGGISYGVTLLGPEAGISPANATPRIGGEAIINSGNPAIRISTTDSVTIDGFTFATPTGVPIDSYTTGNLPTIQNNIFNSTDGLFLANSATLAFNHNYLTNLVAGDEGLFLAGNWDGSTGTTASINNNIWENTLSTGMNLSNVKGTISTNRFSHVQYYGALLSNNTQVNVTGNTFNSITNPDITVPTWGAGVRIYTPGTLFAATITNNAFTSNYVGVGVRMGSPQADITGLNIHVNRNSFVGNTSYGIRNDATGTLDGTCNWWNAANGPGPVGPGSGDTVSTGVSFTPWLVTSNLNGACIGGSIATNKDQCKDGGWMTRFRTDGSTFKNQGDCVSYTNTGR